MLSEPLSPLLGQGGKERSPLFSAGRSLAGDSFSSHRLLATAYDSNWKLKKAIPKGAIPVATSMSRSMSCPGQIHRSKKSATHSGFSRPSALDVTRGGSPQSSPSFSPLSPQSPWSPKSPSSPKLRLGKNKDKSSLLQLKVVPDFSPRPDSGSARSDGEKADGSPKPALPANSTQERQEKPLAELAELAGVPFDIAQQCLETFMDFVSNLPPTEFQVKKEAVIFGTPFDARVDLGSMDTEAFGKACLHIAGCNDFSSLPENFLESAIHAADKDKSGDIDFDEFLYFYYKFSFSEEVLIGPQERQIRLAAREYGIAYDEIGKYKDMFDYTDTNHNGRVSYDEFKVLVTKLLKVPKGEEIPEVRAKDMWKEASRASNGKDLDFFAFVGFYKRYFHGGYSVAEQQESPFEAYYHNVRRVSTYTSSDFH